MTAWYVGNLATAGTNSGSLANPWKGFASVVWASLAAGDTLNVIGSVEYTAYTPMGAHNGVEGSEVIIQSHGLGGQILASGDGSFMLDRSNTILYGVDIVGRVVLESAAASYATKGYNLQVDSCTWESGGGLIFSNTDGGVSGDTEFGKIKLHNCDLSGVTGAVYLLGVGAFSRKVNGVEVSDCLIDGVTGSALELRFESAVTAGSYINDVIIKRNRITNVGSGGSGGQFIRLIANPSAENIPSSDRFDISDNYFDGDGLIGGANAIGGVAIQGYGKTSTSYENKYQRNVVKNSYGAYGGCNILVSNYVDISANEISNITAGTIDANGILIDYYNNHIKAYNNTMANINGKVGAHNSGAAVMILYNTQDVHVHHNRSIRSRIGLYHGGITSDNIVSNDNEFLECTVEGLFHTSSANPVVINNRFTGYGASSTSIVSVQNNSNLTHGYNSFENFTNAPVNQTLNATESTSKISKFGGTL